MAITPRIANNGKLQIVIAGYYDNPAHIETPYTYGVYGKMPSGPVRDCWSDSPHMCRDWMEWAYNNSNQPAAEWNAQFQRRVAFLDASHANAARNIGSLKSIWKKFEIEHRLHTLPLDDVDINVLEEQFWQYYISHNAEKFKRGVSVFEQYICSRRDCMTAEQRAFEQQHAPHFADDTVWIAGCRDYLRHLVYTSPRGYLMEVILFAALRDIYGGTSTESDIIAERQGIDGYFNVNGERIPISLKPDTYHADCISPLYNACWITYSKRQVYFPDLVFEVQAGQELLVPNSKGV